MHPREKNARQVAAAVRARIEELASATATRRAGGAPGFPEATAAAAVPFDAAADAAADAALEAVRSLPDPLRTDPWVFRMVVGGLVLALLGCVAIIGLLSLTQPGRSIDVPDALVALSSGALGALAGLLAPSPVRRG